ncbi:MAG: DUF4835 family protein [Cyclobacteriaceae bacterium]
MISQELNCNVIINAERVQTQERQIFENLKRDIYDFMNNRVWTEDEFRSEEKIDCNLLINVTSLSNLRDFSANAQIQVSRPIYGTDYESPVLSVIDNNFNFTYTTGQQIIFNENAFSSNLTSLLALYAYAILAIDYDTFSEKGGDIYIDKALNIVNTAQGSGGKGWQSHDGPNTRFSLIDQLNNPQFIPFRKGLYTYHRLAMDAFATDPAEARKKIKALFTDILKIRRLQPISFLLESFFLAKSNEIVDIFSVGSREEKRSLYELLRRIDPTNAQKYEQIIIVSDD